MKIIPKCHLVWSCGYEPQVDNLLLYAACYLDPQPKWHFHLNLHGACSLYWAPCTEAHCWAWAPLNNNNNNGFKIIWDLY